ncbi:hypothetical protein Pmar_PMAR004983, partial [Perkinsus marinus ATCC 50983]
MPPTRRPPAVARSREEVHSASTQATRTGEGGLVRKGTRRKEGGPRPGREEEDP